MEYGTAAYTGTNPIGGGDGYAPRFTASDAHFTVATATELIRAIAEARYDQLIWMARDITCPSATALGTLKGRLASDHKTLQQPHTANTYMYPVIWLAGGSSVHGITARGPGSLCGTGDDYCNCAFRNVTGAQGIEVEDCDIGNFWQGGVFWYGGHPAVWNDDAKRNKVRFCTIHDIQRHGFGYGVGHESSACSLIEGVRFERCRHFIEAAGSRPSSTGDSYEARECVFGEAWYRYYGTGAYHNNHQVDCHGGGAGTATLAGNHIWIHHCDFAANNLYDDAPNVSIRGIMHSECRIWANRTRKLHGGKAGVFDETSLNPAFTLRASDGGAWDGENNLSKYRMYVLDNQYGEWDETPEPPPEEPPINVNTSDIRVTSLETSPVAVGDAYTITATVTNVGDGPGSADIVIGYLAGSTKRPLKTQAVDLEAGESMTVTHTGTATTLGDWTFYSGSLTTILSVLNGMLVTTEVSNA
jgi:hypothetical protein